MHIKNNKSRIFLNSLLVSSSTLVDKTIFFVITIIVARYLTVEQFGEYATALGFATFFSTFMNIGINATLVRAVNLESHYESEHFANTIIIKTALSIVVFLSLIISVMFSNYNANVIQLVIVFGIVRIINEFMSAFYSLYDAKEKFLKTSMYTISFAFSLLLGTILVVIFNGNYFHIAYVRLATVVVFIAIIVITTLSDFSLKYNKTTLKSYVKSAIPFSVSSIYGNLRQRVSILIISFMLGTRPTGIFTNGTVFLDILMFIPINFNRVILPFLYKGSKDNDKNRLQFTFDIFSKNFAIISFYLFLVFFLFSDSLIITIFGKKYYEAIPILKLSAFAIPLMFNIAITIIIAVDMQKYNTHFLGIATLFNVAGNLILVKLLNIEGAVYALIGTNLIMFTLTHAFLLIKKYVSLKKVFNTYAALIFIVVICCGLFYYSLRDLFFGYSFIIITLSYCLLVVLFLIRRDDIRIMKETLNIKNK